VSCHEFFLVEYEEFGILITDCTSTFNSRLREHLMEIQVDQGDLGGQERLLSSVNEAGSVTQVKGH
jgi:hypothetical protein